MRRRLLSWTGRSQGEDGQAMFEFVLLLPVLIIAVLFIVDGGVWMYKFVTVSNAVRDAARYASVDCGVDGPCDFTLVQAKAISSSSGMLSSSDTWDIHWDDGGDGIVEKGDSVVVSVHQDHPLLFFPISVGVASCVEMRLEKGNSVVPQSGGC